jgi:hypothetical protein
MPTTTPHPSVVGHWILQVDPGFSFSTREEIFEESRYEDGVQYIVSPGCLGGLVECFIYGTYEPPHLEFHHHLHAFGFSGVAEGAGFVGTYGSCVECLVASCCTRPAELQPASP